MRLVFSVVGTDNTSNKYAVEGRCWHAKRCYLKMTKRIHSRIFVNVSKTELHMEVTGTVAKWLLILRTDTGVVQAGATVLYVTGFSGV